MPATPIYMDYNAHAPLDARVRARLMRAYQDLDGNPHAASREGEAAHRAIVDARAQVAALIRAKPNDIVFTSGATEANNLALRGLAEHLAGVGRRTILVSAGEHPSVLVTAAGLSALGFNCRSVPLRADGQVDLECLDRLLSPEVGLVSVAAANHEVGALQPLAEISSRVRAVGAVFHTDLAQAAGKIPLDAGLFDLASLSAHKLNGPIGVGALYVSRALRQRMAPILLGGGQEGGLRSGTLPTALCVGFGAACALAAAEMAQEQVETLRRRGRLLAGMVRAGGIHVNGGLERRLAGNLNVCVEGVDAEALVLRLRDHVSLSTGSACTAQSLDPSAVLLAMGLSREAAETAVRISIGRFTTDEDVDRAVAAFYAAVMDLRGVRPGARIEAAE